MLLSLRERPAWRGSP